MNKALKALAAVALAVSLSGCCNYMLHRSGYAEIYGGTRYQWDIVTAPFTDSKSYVSELATFFFPFVVVDLPCEVVFDTVTLPFDAWQTWSRNQHGRRDALGAEKEPTADELVFPINTAR